MYQCIAGSTAPGQLTPYLQLACEYTVETNEMAIEALSDHPVG
jgi:hypothetical protein